MNIVVITQRFCLGLSLVLLTACGFHLRGTGTTGLFSFSTIYIDNPNFVKTAELAKTALSTRGIKIVATPEAADVVLKVYDGVYKTETLSVNSNGQVSQYRLLFRLDYQIVKPLTSADEINTSRDLDFDASQFIAKESEQRILREDMERDTSERLTRILSRLKVEPLATTLPDKGTMPNPTP